MRFGGDRRRDGRHDQKAGNFHTTEAADRRFNCGGRRATGTLCGSGRGGGGWSGGGGDFNNNSASGAPSPGGMQGGGMQGGGCSMPASPPRSNAPAFHISEAWSSAMSTMTKPRIQSMA